MSKFIRTIKSNETTAKDHLKWLVYQVYNGGIYQYIINGYADRLLEYEKTHDISDELKSMGAPEDGVDAFDELLEELYSNTPSYDCPNCDGLGYHEEEDSYEKEQDCYYCNGQGTIEAEKWSDSEQQSWMDEYDNWFGKLNMHQLDDWTGQSHHHSHSLDMMEQNKKK